MNAPAPRSNDAASHADPADRRYGAVAAAGMAWTIFQAAWSKGLSFIAQLVLGWLLSKDDYALYAIAASFSAIVAALRNGGMQKVLLQRGGNAYNAWAGPVFQTALVFNMIGAALLAASAPFVADFYDEPALPPLLGITAASIVLATPAMILQSKILADLRFGQSARITSLSAGVFYGSMIAFALFGLGPLSFVLPRIVIAVFETVAFGLAARSFPVFRRMSAEQLRSLLRASGWVMVSMLALALANQGDFLVVGRLQPDLLADYFFGVSLSVAIYTVLGNGVNSVLMPTLSQLRHDHERFSRAFAHSIRIFVLVFTPACVMAAGFASPLVHACWNSKWDQSIIVVQVFMLSLAFRLLTPIALAALEARAQWRKAAMLLLLDGVGTFAAAVIGCLIGGMSAIILCMCANRIAMSILQCVLVGQANGLSVRSVLVSIAPSATVAAIAVALGYGAATGVHAISGPSGLWLPSIAFSLAFLCAYVVLCARLLPLRTSEAMNAIRSLLRVRHAVTPSPDEDGIA